MESCLLRLLRRPLRGGQPELSHEYNDEDNGELS
jgi:hypothetical protein